MDPGQFLFQLAIWAPPVLFAITLHEVAHGWVARYYGDNTAASLGRLSLNPFRHIDPVGTVLVPGLTLFLGGIIFGWAKPVPVVMRNLKQPRIDMAKVAIAGPLANFVMALGWALLMRIGMLGADGFSQFIAAMGMAGVLINIILLVLNLFPIPPLDGSRVVNAFLPENMARVVDSLERWGLLILLALLFTGILGRVLWPALAFAESLILGLVGLGGSGAGMFSAPR